MSQSPAVVWRQRLARIAVAVTLLVGALAARQLALPGGTFACSCAGPVTLTGREEAVFIGTAGQPQPDGTYRFAVERWFVGGNAAAIDVMSGKQVLADGGTVFDTCGLLFEIGDRLILTASIADGIYRPNTCSPHAAVATVQGQQLLSDAVARFGEGSPPGPSVETPIPDDADLTGFALGAVGILVLVVVIAVVGAAWRRREEGPAG